MLNLVLGLAMVGLGLVFGFSASRVCMASSPDAGASPL